MAASPNNRPPVGIVIVNFNLKDSLRETLESFKKANYPDVQIVVSDNASKDGSQEMVRTLFPEVHLLAHETEQGYARAASLGMAYLTDKTKYIFSTTNDVIVDPEMLNVLVDYAEQDPKPACWARKFIFSTAPIFSGAPAGAFIPCTGTVIISVGNARTARVTTTSANVITSPAAAISCAPKSCGKSATSRKT